MAWLKKMIGARWFPYAAIGVVSIVLTAFGWGYMRGSLATELRMTEQMNKALSAQLKRERETARKDLVAVTNSLNRVQEVKRRVADIERPTNLPCADLGADWLRAFNDGVRAANTNTEATD